MYRVFLWILLCIDGLSKGQGFPQQNDEETTTVEPATTKEVIYPSYCRALNETKPDFYNQGRRISEAKCNEYIWELRVRLENERNDYKCLHFLNTVLNIGGVIGGYLISPGDYPHMGALGWKSSAPNGTWVFKCGGSLISEKFVLTAAHCSKASTGDTSIADPIPKIVRLGDKNIIDIPYYVEPMDRNISRMILHPLYDPPKKYYDIALIELDKPVVFSKSVHPACLWNRMTTEELGTKATITGWGVIETGSLEISPEVRAAEVDLFNEQACNNLLKPSCNRNWCGMQDQICAGKYEGGVDACQGDSGGPLQVKIPQPKASQGQMHYLIGVISFGIGCAHPHLPGIYTKVASFVDWIEAVVWADVI